jgi:XRE family transcriptional regulator, regulator of sulfur utilization
MKLQDRLKEVRTARDLTLKGLGERTGLSVSYLSDMERGRTTPPLVTLEMLATALDMTVIDLLTGVDFAGEQTEASLPHGLAELLKETEYRHEITPEWIAMLSKIQLQGKRPQSKREWLELYLHLKRILEK